MSKIQATIVGHSKSPQGHTLMSVEAVFPRFILAELNTHRALSKNSASSRAIPFNKMVERAINDPFIPLAFQKEHKGMQGTEYWTDELFGDTNPMKVSEVLKNIHLQQRDEAVIQASLMTKIGATKQLANRYLEPFMWHKVLISGTDEGWENFFNLRCPQYSLRDKNNEERIYRSRRDAIGSDGKPMCMVPLDDTLGWLQLNKGQAEIHMMALAESIWDAMNESKPKELKAGEWHIPYLAAFQQGALNEGYSEQGMVKIATGMAAITSYTVVGDEKEKPYQTLIGIHDKMIVANPFHASPFEHIAQVPTLEEYKLAIKGECSRPVDHVYDEEEIIAPAMAEGWFRNFHGFKQYRQIIEDDKSNR